MRVSALNLSEKNRRRSSNPVYPYRTSRAGYRGVEQNITGAVGLDVVWLNAHKNKEGVIDNERVQGVTNRVSAIKQSTDTPNSLEVLDKALELPEYPGRVRGAGYGVPKDHFLPRNKRRRFARADREELEARIREKVEARVREETKAEVDGLYAKLDSCMKKIEELQHQQHGNAANAPSSCLNENPTQAPEVSPGVESPEVSPRVESPQNWEEQPIPACHEEVESPLPIETEVTEGKSCTPSTHQLMKHFSEKGGQSLEVNFVPEIYNGRDDVDWITAESVKEVHDYGELSASVISVYNRYLYENFVKPSGKKIMFLSPHKLSMLTLEEASRMISNLLGLIGFWLPLT